MRWDMQSAQTAPMVDGAIRLPPQQKINVFSGATYRCYSGCESQHPALSAAL